MRVGLDICVQRAKLRVFKEQERTWTRQRTLNIANGAAKMVRDLVDSRELGYMSCSQNHNTTR